MVSAAAATGKPAAPDLPASGHGVIRGKKRASTRRIAAKAIQKHDWRKKQPLQTTLTNNAYKVAKFGEKVMLVLRPAR